MARQENAFTLVELMVAVTLGVAVIAAAYASLSSSISGSRRMAAFIEQSTTLANISDTISRQLANAYYSSTSDLTPVFTVAAGQESSAALQAGAAPTDTITFSYAWHSTAAQTYPQWPYYTVTYHIADATSDSPGGLARQVVPLWPRSVTDTPIDELIAPEVRGLAVSCFDGTVWTTSDTWDAASSGLPRAVRIDLYVDSERFAKDPWRIDSVSPARQPVNLETFHVIAWLSGLGQAASATSGSTPATGGVNAPAQ